MRQSEAIMLLEHLEDDYDGPLQLEVWNLQQRGHPFNLPEMEHPFFVVGIPKNVEEGRVPVKQTKTEKEQIVVWNAEGKKMNVKGYRCRKLTAQSRISSSEIYVYDTRRREFVPAPKFRLPPDQS